jgi:hypothetical protein
MCLPGMTAGALTRFQSASFTVLALPRSRSAKPGAVLSYGVLSAQTEKVVEPRRLSSTARSFVTVLPDEHHPAESMRMPPTCSA